jgi:hypothetical protein
MASSERRPYCRVLRKAWYDRKHADSFGSMQMRGPLTEYAGTLAAASAHHIARALRMGLAKA